MKYFLLASTFITFCFIGKAQKFPLGIEPLSYSMIVEMKHPIKYISTDRLTGKEEKSYMYEGAVNLNGISFPVLFLIFTRDKLTSMRFGIRNKEDFDKVVSSLNGKYKKLTCADGYCYQNGNIKISVYKSEEPRNAYTQFAYLFYNYESSGEL